MSAFLFLVHFAATWYMAGLCWLIQRVQYPLMDRVGATGYADYEQAHVARIGPVVAPVMLVELLSGLALLAMAAPGARHPLFLTALALLALIWVSTFLLQVPLHDTLSSGFDPSAHAALVRTNWIRTLAWTVRGALIFWLIWSGATGATS